MSNRLDKLFRESVPKHHLPNNGPDWAGLEVKLTGSSNKKPIILLTLAILSCSFLTIYWFHNSNPNPQLSENLSPQNIISDNTLQSKEITSDDMVSGKITESKSNSNTINKYSGNALPWSDSFSQKFITDNEEVISVKVSDKTSENDIIPNSKEMEMTNTFESRRLLNENPANALPESKSDSLNSPTSDSKEEKKPHPSIIQSSAKTNIKPPITSKHLISIYASFAPTIIKSMDNITSDTNDLKTHKGFANLKNKGEKMKDALGLDIGIRFSPIKKLSVGTGFIYEKRTEQVNYNFKRNEVPVLDSATGEIFGYAYLSDSVAEKISYSSTSNYSYIGIPITVDYKLIQSKKLGLGIHMNCTYLKQTALKGKTINSTTLRLENLNASNSIQLKNMFNAGLGVNIDFAVSKNIQISVSPAFRKQLSTNTKTSKPKQTSVNLSIQYFIF